MAAPLLSDEAEEELVGSVQSNSTKRAWEAARCPAMAKRCHLRAQVIRSALFTSTSLKVWKSARFSRLPLDRKYCMPRARLGILLAAGTWVATMAVACNAHPTCLRRIPVWPPRPPSWFVGGCITVHPARKFRLRRFRAAVDLPPPHRLGHPACKGGSIPQGGGVRPGRLAWPPGCIHPPLQPWANTGAFPVVD